MIRQSRSETGSASPIAPMDDVITYTHRLVLPVDANHRETLYAGSLLRIALEAAYACASRSVGRDANLALRRVLRLECYRPVPVGEVIEIQAAPLHVARAYIVIGLVGSPLSGECRPWMDGLLGFAQIDDDGRPAPLPEEVSVTVPPGESWTTLKRRFKKLQQIRT